MTIAFLSALARAEDQHPLELRITNVRTLIGVGGEYLKDELHVVVTNRSKSEIRIYDQWNSWGYDNLTFTVEFEDGHVQTLRRFGGRTWTGNAPDEIFLQTGQQYAYSVWLKPEDKKDRTNAWGPIEILNGFTPGATFKAHHPGGRYSDGRATGAITSVPMAIRLIDEWHPGR